MIKPENDNKAEKSISKRKFSTKLIKKPAIKEPITMEILIVELNKPTAVAFSTFFSANTFDEPT
ncbi:MAG: hypothetical protein U9Q97_01485 [Acidobacteriota bacterium]|nr:hypothetical protein [Acidobacteriota bacterium]